MRIAAVYRTDQRRYLSLQSALLLFVVHRKVVAEEPRATSDVDEIRRGAMSGVPHNLLQFRTKPRAPTAFLGVQAFSYPKPKVAPSAIAPKHPSAHQHTLSLRSRSRRIQIFGEAPNKDLNTAAVAVYRISKLRSVAFAVERS